MTVDVTIGIIAKVLKVEAKQVSGNLDSTDMWDSFSRIEVIVALEDQLGVSFSLEEISGILTVSDLLESLKGKA